MKKKLFAVVLTATMVVTSAMTALAADTTTGLIGHFKFDESLKNEVGDKDATPVEKGTGAVVGKEKTDAKFNYVDGIDGKAIYMNEGGSDVGLNLNIKPADGKAYTISVWVKALGCNFANPIVWAGKSNQNNGENWVGIWPGLMGDYVSGPQLGSNSSERIGAEPTGMGAGTKEEDNKTFDWLNVTITVDNGVGKLYYNGTLVAQTPDDKSLPDIVADGDDTVSIYLGANGWDAPVNGYVDTLFVFDRVLTTEDIQQLVTESKTNASVTIKEFEGIKETTTNKPSTGSNSNWFEEEKDDGNKINPVVIGVIIAAVVIVVIVAVVVVAKSKKKGTDSDN